MIRNKLSKLEKQLLALFRLLHIPQHPEAFSHLGFSEFGTPVHEKAGSDSGHILMMVVECGGRHARDDGKGGLPANRSRGTGRLRIFAVVDGLEIPKELPHLVRSKGEDCSKLLDDDTLPIELLDEVRGWLPLLIPVPTRKEVFRHGIDAVHAVGHLEQKYRGRLPIRGWTDDHEPDKGTLVTL